MTRLLMILLLFAAGGCVKASEVQSDLDPPPLPVDRDLISERDAGVAVAITVPADAWDWLASHTSKLGVTTTTPIEVLDENKDGLVVHNGTSINLTMTRDQALVEFSGDALPTASKRVGPLPVRTTIKTLTLKPDGSGLARTSLGTWPFRWLNGGLSSTQAACECGCGKSDCTCTKAGVVASAAATGPTPIEVVMETPVDENGQRFCEPCAVAEKLVANAKVPLPFKLKVVEVPQIKRQAYPYFFWKSASGKEWQSVGFSGGVAALSYSVLATIEQ